MHGRLFMRICILFGLIFHSADFAAAEPATDECQKIEGAAKGPNLNFVRRFTLQHPGGTLPAELSGLAVQNDPNAPGGFWLWTLADRDSELFRISSSGLIDRKIELGVDFRKNLEGISLAGQRLLAVRETPAAIVSVGLDDLSGTSKQVVPLNDMRNFSTAVDPKDDKSKTLERYISGLDPNDMLEGIAFDAKQNRVFLLKEKRPALLIEASSDFKNIDAITVLDCGKAKKCSGNAVFAQVTDDIDFSDIAYDNRREKLWLLSDKLRAAFLYDPKTRAFSASPLKTANGECVNKPEGIALLAAEDGTESLFVVNDNQEPNKSFIFEYAIEERSGRRP